MAMKNFKNDIYEVKNSKKNQEKLMEVSSKK